MMSCLNAWKIGMIAVLAAGLPASAVAMQWPDTGQTVCYDNTKQIPCPTDENSPFYGQDAQYQGPARSYTKLGQGGVELPDDAAEWIMVRDNVTGLVWELKNNMDDTPDYSNPHDADNYYVWCNKNYAYTIECDRENNTDSFIGPLNNENFGGFSDWRMPSIKELSSIFYAGLPPHVDWNYFKPMMHHEDHYHEDWYCSLDQKSSEKLWVWFISFSGRDVESGPVNFNYFIFAVRGGK